MTTHHRLREHLGLFRLPGCLAGLLLAACGGGGGGAGSSGPAPPSDTVPPAVVSTIPAALETGVDLAAPIRVVFSEPIDPSTVSPATIPVTRAGAPVTGNLCFDATYTVTVTTGIRDLAGNPLAVPYSWQFTTAPGSSSEPLCGILVVSGGMTVSYDGTTNTLTLFPLPAVPIDNVSVRAIAPSSDNNTEAAWETTVTTDAEGCFSVPGAVSGNILLVAEKVFPSGDTRRILGVGTLYFTGATAVIEIPVKDVTPTPTEVRLDRFCEQCHPLVQTAPGQIRRDVHFSGITPVNANKPAGILDAFGRVTCESCHSVHAPTGILHFVLAPYETGELCLQCH